MNSSSGPFLSLFLLLFLLSYPPPSHAAPPIQEYCDTQKTALPRVRANIARVLATLQAKTPANGFFTTSYDLDGRDRVYGLAQCRQDLSAEACRVCLRDGPPQTSKGCRDREDVWIWFDHCFFHYDTAPFAGEYDPSFKVYTYSDNNVTDNAAEQKRFAKEMRSLWGGIKGQALGKNNLGFGRGQIKFAPNVTIYGLAQCTRDLPVKACSKCLSTTISQITAYNPYKEAGRGVSRSCYVRYDSKPFFSAATAGPSKASLSP